MKLRNLINKWKYAEESVYIFSELHKKERARKAMRFYELKIIIQLAVLILICQILIMVVLNLMGII